LDALIAGYRFDPKELRQLMRQLFRKEYAKEQEETQLSLDTQPGGLSMSTPPSSERIHGGAVGTPSEQIPRVSMPTPGPQPIVPQPPMPAPPPTDDGKGKGFWGSLFRKRK